ncbi:MAG: flagellar export protein FliJ [Planctomycetaceae bacterium]|nr:flagellar export protein FliJ [Planctomycetales bacterium]MCB9924782.1 flagellar export protein FliJ [Planctomycetaceae bacterium]
MKLREADRQQRRAELAEAFQAESVLRQQATQLEHDIREIEKRSRIASSPGRVHVDRVLDTHRYKLILKSQVMVLSQKETQLQAEIEKRRAALAAADRDVRVLEKLKDRQREEHAAAESQRELKQLDEIAAQRWGRNKEEL